MTKTKRQLRAEAVERLKEYHDWEPSQKSLANVTLPIWPMSANMNNDKRVDALIDLLTDDELPDGDPVSMMRNWSLYEMGVLVHPNNSTANTLELLADMVERDYVRREYHCKVVDNKAKLLADILDESDELREQCDVLEITNKRQARKIHNLCELNANLNAEFSAMRDRAWDAESERDELLQKVQQLEAECDEWKAKAEQAMESYADAKDARDYWQARATMDGNGTCPNTMGHTSNDSETCTENYMGDVSTLDNPRSHEPDRKNNVSFEAQIFTFDDSREKLEADIMAAAYMTYYGNGEPRLDGSYLDRASVLTAFEWLDRQAAITKRETLCRRAYEICDE